MANPPRWLDESPGDGHVYAANLENTDFRAAEHPWQPSVIVDNSHNDDEGTLLTGFRAADDITRGHMLDMARKALSLFWGRSEKQ